VDITITYIFVQYGNVRVRSLCDIKYVYIHYAKHADRVSSDAVAYKRIRYDHNDAYNDELQDRTRS